METRVMKHRGFKITADDTPMIEGLKFSYREILAASDTHKANAVAMATALNINIGTVKSRLHRARTALLVARNAQ
jgi:DNA-directed RNA polymerase specialized sigma24 family protein